MHGSAILASRRKRVWTPAPEDRKPEDVRTEVLLAMREILRYAIMTLAALPDPDARFLGWAQMPVNVVHSVKEAYGYSSTFVRRFQPTPAHVQQMERVGPWLAWMRRECGEEALQRLIGWSMGVPAWKLGQREGCSEKTVMNRMDRSVAAVIRQFSGADIVVEEVEEPIDGVKYAVIFERPDATSNSPVKFMKIYIGGRGMWRGGKYLRDGSHRAEKYRT